MLSEVVVTRRAPSGLAPLPNLKQPTAKPASRHPFLRPALAFYTVALVGDSLAAYNVIGIPIPWLIQAASLVFACLLISRTRWVAVPGFAFLAGLCLWGGLVTLANVATGDYASMMPINSTTTYPIYVSLRLLVFASFAAQIYLIYWLLKQGAAREVIRRTTNVGVFVALTALYIYVAQVTGLPEPPRTRLGTHGFEQVTTFSYAFHRAMGTFREPSDLGAWLVIPLFCSLITLGRFRIGKTMLITITVLLTGSLAAIGSTAVGLMLALAIVRPRRGLGLWQLMLVLATIIASYGAFSLMVTQYDGGSTNLISVLQERIEPMLEQGVAGTNRDYIYEYLENTTVPWLGTGFGHPQLQMAHDMNITSVTSLLNLYITMLYSAGWIGLGLLICFLAVPVVEMLKRRNCDEMVLTFLSAAYFSWLLRCFMCIDEPSFSMAVSYSLLAWFAAPKLGGETVVDLCRTDMLSSVPL